MPKAYIKTSPNKAYSNTVRRRVAPNVERECAYRVAVRLPEAEGRAPKEAAARNSSEPIGVSNTEPKKSPPRRPKSERLLSLPGDLEFWRLGDFFKYSPSLPHFS